MLVETNIPARLDALPWGRFHTLVVVALGITWILDGLEVTLAGALSGALKDSATLGLSNSEIGRAGSAYVGGAVMGALFFGWLTDRLGRKKLFFITLAVYLTATAATALAWSFASYASFRLLTGAGIGGEYTAINSTIQELIPARVRGWTDLAINGSFWIGAAGGAGARLAPRLSDRGDAGARHLLHAALDPREPPLADDARAYRARRGGRGRDRAAICCGIARRRSASAGQLCEIAGAHPHATA
jgi:MFS family permease